MKRPFQETTMDGPTQSNTFHALPNIPFAETSEDLMVFLPTTYVVWEKVMFSPVFVCLQQGDPPPPPEGQNKKDK